MATIQEATMDLALKAYPNELTPDVDNDYTVRVETHEMSLGLEHIATKVAKNLNKSVNEVRSILEEACQETANYAASGFCISTPLFTLRPMASGVIMEEELSQPVDREKISVYGSLSQGALLKEAFAKTHLKLFLQPAVTGPYITGMVSAAPVNPVTQTRAPIKGGKMAVLNVKNGKIVGDDPSVGITLTSVSNPETSFFIGPDDISPNTPTKLQFILPAGVTDGEWRVKITTQYSSSGQTKAPRSFELARPVNIGSTTAGGDGGGEEEGGGGGGSMG
ncbi:DUF4469 domain-containing protein [Mediterranea massiliensis]|uniref:DUF4469 domain-containing protein n=1 Tax=Mediterranea massiliensis TaxID=1841865 RepID=UPI0025A3A366|nr:DUF4469 domain-containing protein [Mediterranea massiliensis]MDM8336715.1 DUF4469 domain-containing protein [Mediterranea massiliensis]